MNENKLDDKIDYPVMMKLPRVPGGIVRAIVIIFCALIRDNSLAFA